ncbi:MAG: PKD domain-containing protein, partial [Gemmataceae bacterium]|nr:PKD domain-containing protein [Gemmataceae bacterium]
MVWFPGLRHLLGHSKTRGLKRRAPLHLEELEARYVPAFTRLALDFDTPSSPTAPGFTKVAAPYYSAARGFGFKNTGTVTAIDRGFGDPLTRDFHQGRAETFNAKMAKGTYLVTVYTGDALMARKALRINAEGVYATTVPATAAGQFAVSTFIVNLSDKQLNLRFAGSAKAKFALDAITIVPWAPSSANAGADIAINEGSTHQFQGSGSGAGPLSYDWDFGDGATASGTATPTKTYDDQGTFTVTLTVTDANGVRTSDSAVVTVNNVAPTATIGNSGAVDEGGNATVWLSNAADASAADAAAGFKYSFDFDNDGTFDITDSTSSSATVPAALLADGSGVATVRACIIDKDGGYTDYTTAISVDNVAPTATIGNSGAVNEGGTATVSLSNPTDTSAADMAAGFKYSFDFDNNGQFEVTNSAGSSATVPASFLADGPGARTVRARIIDKDGGYTDYTTSIAINNVAPTATIGNSGPVNEGGTATVSLSNPADVSADIAAGFKYSFDFDNNGSFEVTNSSSSSATVPASFLADGPGARTIRARIIDKDGGFKDYTTSITINNVAPTASFTATVSSTNDKTVNFASSVSDPGTADTFTYAWDFGDGATGAAASPAHAYAQYGTYTVQLTVTDKDGASVTVSKSVDVPAPSPSVINVSTEAALRNAVNNLRSNQTIVMAAGTYNLTDTLYIPQGIANVTVRGATGDSGDVVVAGAGMSGSIRFGFWVGNTQNITFADFTLKNIKEHGIILNAGAEAPVFRNLHVVDIGDQFLKANPDGSGGGVDNGLVEFCVLEYSTVAPDSYTNGVDVHGGANWVIRHNVFRNFRSAGLTGPVLLIWNHSRDTIVENNTFINNVRDIAFGLDAATADDHSGGIIRNNFIARSAGVGGDVAIGVWNSPNTKVLHNTVLLNGNYPNAVEYRFANTTGVSIRNNLTDAAIVSRDGATGTVANNYTAAQAAWFVNPGAGDLHLKATATAAINKVTTLADAAEDFDGDTRPGGTTADYGADEYIGAPADTTAPTVSITAPANNATVSATVSITADASDDVGVIGVQFLLDGQAVGSEDTTAPYSFSWNTTGVANGSYTLAARARDAAGNVTTSAGVTVTVNNADTAAPSVSMTSPSNGATVSGSVNLAANASDNVGVVGVQFLVNGQAVGSEDTAAPYSLSWNT